MCTLTWLVNKEGYEVFFNRDEQRARPQATLPYYDNETDSIMPIDPHGKGTWIAVNSSGITLCLLNNYQAAANINKTDCVSRGSLIPRLIKYKSSSEILQQLHDINMNDYMPFWLCVFPESLKSDNEIIYSYQWDGYELTQEEQNQPMISSAVSLVDVQKTRIELFEKMIDHDSSSEHHLAYHSSHEPEKGKYSVCMHRDDARTQSMSHIAVGDVVEFRYHDASPCMHEQWSKIVI